MKYVLSVISTFLLLVACATVSIAQGTKASRQNNHKGDSQDVYFNADARQVIQPSTLTTDKVSATSIGNVLTLLFDGAKVSLQNESDPLTGAWVATVQVPTRTTGKAVTSYLQHVRGAVIKSEDSRVVLIVNLGGKTFTTEYPYGTKSNGDVLLKFISPVKPKPATGSYMATILVVVERRVPNGAVLVSVDSLDVAARPATPSNKK